MQTKTTIEPAAGQPQTAGPDPKKNRGRKRARLKPIIHPHAAGIDIGARAICVAVPEDRAEESVRTFRTFTADLLALADWLVACRITSVAMESTGNYWIPLFQILDARGLEVVLVNARHVRHVPGRKSDVLDSQWLQDLHSVGLLRASFRPAQEICAVRSLTRFRETLVAQAADQIRYLHNAFDQMNVQLHHVLSDLSGTTGLAIVRAILAGERDPKMLARHRDARVKASVATIEESLRGDWRPEHLLVLKLAFASWEQVQAQLVELEAAITRAIRALAPKVDVAAQPLPADRKRRSLASARLELRAEFYRVLGTDLTAIPAVSALTAQVFVTEVGTDVERFATADHFASWLGLCPGTKISGGKVLCARSRPGKPRLALALRQSALSLLKQHSALGARYRRLRARLGAPKALTAMAHQLARIMYAMVKERCPYDDTRLAKLEEAYTRHQRASLEKAARRLGYQLVLDPNFTESPTVTSR
jgi:transposase